MTIAIASLNSVTETPAAEPEEVAAHFARLLQFETDCWDVHDSLAADDPGFVLLDVRSPQMYQAGHIEQAINFPYGKINERNLAPYPADALFVVSATAIIAMGPIKLRSVCRRSDGG